MGHHIWGLVIIQDTKKLDPKPYNVISHQPLLFVGYQFTGVRKINTCEIESANKVVLMTVIMVI